MKPVSKEYAQACAEEYQKIYDVIKYPPENLTALGNAYTETIGFPLADLEIWMENIRYKTDCDNLRVVLGVYVDPGPLPDNPYGFDEATINYLNTLQGRLTSFLWPFHGNSEASHNENGQESDTDPENLGELNP